MSWFKVDDGFLTHPKVYGIKSGPLALWLRAGVWCAGELTDGAIPDRALRGLGAKPAHVADLVARGLWEPTENGFVFHDWLDYQPSREQILKSRTETLHRVRKHRNSVTNARVTPAPDPGPVPDPILTETTLQAGPSVVSAPPAWVSKSTTRPDLDGFNWFNQLKGGAAPPLRTCKLDYEWIGGRTPAERHQVAQNIAATQWCADNRKNVTPAHVVKYWESYVEGPRNRQQLAVSVNPLDVAHGLMKSAEKAYHEAHRYNEPIEPALKAWEAATENYNALSKARAS